MTAILHSAGVLPPGLVAAVWPGIELANGFRQSGGFSRTATPGGDAVRLTGAQHLLQRLPAGFNFPLTFVSVFRRNVASASRVLASVGSGTQRHLLYFASGNGTALYSAAGAATGQALGPTISDTTNVYFAAGRISSASSRDVFVNGVFYAPNTATVNTTPQNVHAIGAYWNNDAPAAGFTSDADILFSGLWNRALSNAEILELQQSWRRITRPAQRRIWVPVSTGGGAVTVTGQSVTQGAQSTAGAIAQTHLLAGAPCIQANQSSSAAVTQTHVLAGQSVIQANTCTAGAVGAITPHELAGADCSQVNGSTAGAVSQVHLLTGAPSQQVNTSTAGAVSAVPVITLTGAACSQANTSTSAPVTQVHVLMAAPVAVDNIASASAVVQVHMLAGASCSQVNTSTSGLIRGPVTAPELGAEMSVAESLTYLSIVPGVSHLSVAQSTAYLSVADATRRISVKAAP